MESIICIDDFPIKTSILDGISHVPRGFSPEIQEVLPVDHLPSVFNLHFVQEFSLPSGKHTKMDDLRGFSGI
jgi:hypothetical protein